MLRAFLILLLLGTAGFAWGQDSIYVCTSTRQILRYDLPTRKLVSTGVKPANDPDRANQDIVCTPAGVIYGSGEARAADFLHDSTLIYINGQQLYTEVIGLPGRIKLGIVPVTAAGDIVMAGPTTAYYASIDNHIFQLTLSPAQDTLLASEDLGKVQGLANIFGLVYVKLTGCNPHDAILCFSPY